MQKKLRFAVLGCGYWSQYQIKAWFELEGIELVALYNRTLSKAEALAVQFNVPRCYDDAEQLFREEELDFVDIITDVDTHPLFTAMAARHGVAVICQKPMAPTLQAGIKMLKQCDQANVPLFIHENFRWQAPIRKLKEIMDSGIIGIPFKARVSFCSAFPVFNNQPFLAELEKFILIDIGSHILDICRFLFGEAESLYCQTATVNPSIRGEDVANVMMKMKSGIHCYAEMSYSSILEKESFPQTFVLLEGAGGSLHLTHDFELKVTTPRQTVPTIVSPVFYPWADPDYAVVHSSIVDCNRNILEALQGKTSAETTGADNLETVKLVWAAYESAKTNTLLKLENLPVMQK
ncbi:Gfo/Idh/MocA family protein [Flavitalea flava]